MPTIDAVNRLQSQIGMSATPKEMTYLILAVIVAAFYLFVIKPLFS